MAPAIAQSHREVCFDRRLASRVGPHVVHDAARFSGDLHQLLDALGVTAPLVLVGHSWGGALIRRYAADHPDDVAGMVLVDASHENTKGMMPTWWSRALYTVSMLALRLGPIRRRLLRTLGFEHLPPETLELVDTLPWLAEGRTAVAEFAGMGPSLQELARNTPELPRVPARVLLAAGRPGLVTKLGRKQLAAVRAVWEQAVAGRDDITLQSVADSGHYISLDQPQAVIEAIEDVARRASLGRIE